MKASQSPSKPAAAAKPKPSCGYPTCTNPAPLKCTRCLETHYCSAKHQKEYWPLHKKLCVAPMKKISAICRKEIVGFDVGVYSESLDARRLWPTSNKNLRQLASGEGFNEYFRNQFNRNEEQYLRRKEIFDVLEIVGGRGCHHNVRVHLETQVLMITRSEDLVKLIALAKLCSPEFFDDPYDTRRYIKRVKEGYEEQLGRDSEKALEATLGLIACTKMSRDKIIEKYRDVLKRMERALGEENVVTLGTLNSLGCELDDNKEYEEAIRVYERCLAGRMKVLEEDYLNTLAVLNNLGEVYRKLKNYENPLEYYERDLKGSERILGTTHPDTLATVQNIASVYYGREDYGKAEELFQRAFEGFEAQLGKDQ